MGSLYQRTKLQSEECRKEHPCEKANIGEEQSEMDSLGMEQDSDRRQRDHESDKGPIAHADKEGLGTRARRYENPDYCDCGEKAFACSVGEIARLVGSTEQLIADAGAGKPY